MQRFGQVNLLKRSILELIAAELIKVNPPRLPDPTVRGGIAEQMKEGDHASSSGGSGSVLPGESPESSGMLFPLSPEKDKPMQSFRSRSKSMDSLRMINVGMKFHCQEQFLFPFSMLECCMFIFLGRMM